MRVNEINVSAGRKFPHPYVNFAMLNVMVSLTATLDGGEDYGEAVHALQIDATGMVELHKGNLLEAIRVEHDPLKEPATEPKKESEPTPKGAVSTAPRNDPNIPKTVFDGKQPVSEDKPLTASQIAAVEAVGKERRLTKEAFDAIVRERFPATANIENFNWRTGLGWQQGEMLLAKLREKKGAKK